MVQSLIRSKRTRAMVVLALLASVFTLLPISAAGAIEPPPDLVINEIMQNPSAVSDGSGEWFELYNPNAFDVDIEGWTIADADFDSHVIANAGPLLVPAEGFLVIGNNADSGTNGGVTVGYSYGGDMFLGNGADELILSDGAAQEVDRVEYDGGPNFPDPTGASMALDDPVDDNNVGSNWCEAVTPFGAGDNGTPGTPNDCGVIVFPDEVTPIYEIQGDGFTSPFEDEPIRTSGIVTADFQHVGGLGGFFLQDPVGDADPTTSDGIFVEAVSPFEVTVGAMVEVAGLVEENFGFTQITGVVEVDIFGADPVPAATEIGPPFDDDVAMEAVEGMLVSFDDTLYVMDTYNLHRYGEAFLTSGGVAVHPTDEFGGGTVAMDDLAAENMANTILLDDGSTWQWPNTVPYFHGAAPGTLRIGDSSPDAVGVISYAFGRYRIQPVDITFDATNPRPSVPNVGGDVIVAGFNVLNYWTTLGERGADDLDQLGVQTDKLVSAIRGTGADVLALVEIENDPAHTPITTLVAALNDAEIGSPWSWVGPVDYYNSYPIRNEIIYRNDRVVPVGDPMTIEDPAFDAIPPGRDDPVGRPPVAQTFMYGPETFTVMSNHFKSKGCSGSSGGDEDQGDGQSCYNATRVLQAQVVLDFVDYIVAETGDADVLVMGDLNAYMEEDPIHEMETEMVNLLEEFTPNGHGYSFFATFAFPYVGRGNLDHAFATWEQSLKVTGAAAWNINADEPRALDWFDTDRVAPGPYRSSDHDPVLVGLAMPNAFIDIGATVFTEDILFIAALGITYGCNPPTNNLFCPERELTVGELAAMIRRAINAPASVTDHFTDDDSSIFEGDINALADLGIMVPCDPNMVCPDAKVTREVTAAMFAAALNLPADATDYFVDDDASLFEDAIQAFAGAGITYGCNPPTNDMFCPTDYLTRGMVAAFFHRAYAMGWLPLP